MKVSLIVLLLVTLLQQKGVSQAQDSTLNNLMLPEGYVTSAYGAIPHYSKSGKGKNTLILIPGWGFDETVFSDFVRANKKRYTIYSVTIPGYGKTSAPPLPKEGTSFGDHYWNKSVLTGLLKLIEDQRLDHPIVVGHFVQGAQVAIRLAIDYPDKVGGVIVLGGPAKFVPLLNGKIMQYPLEMAIRYTDNISAPKFYRTVTKDYFDQNNYMREVYSLREDMAATLWKQNASVPLPVMIRYLLEFHTTDITLETQKIKCPVLVLRPSFKKEWLSDLQNGTVNYIKPQFIDSWEEMRSKNPLIEIQDIPNSSSFVWKDQPDETYEKVLKFISKHMDQR